MNATLASTLIATVYAPTAVVWLATIALALVLPRYAIRRHVPWPLLATLILLLMVAATAMTGLVVKGFSN